jgi:hypothetical protein
VLSKPTEQTLGKKKHPHHLPDNPIAQARTATDAGFYLEAIYIWETLISHDLEQYLNLIQGSNVSFSNLGRLLSKLDESLHGMKRSGNEDELYELIEPLHDWYGACHKAIHALAGINEHSREKWNEAYPPLKKLAREGKRHFKHIHTLTVNIRLDRQALNTSASR